MGYRARVQQRISFGGVVTRLPASRVGDSQSPLARNVFTYPADTLQPRRGFVALKAADGVTDDNPGAVDDEVPIVGMAILSRVSDLEDYLVCSRGGSVWQRRMSGGGEWFEVGVPVASGGELNAATGRFLDGDEQYHDAALFCCTGVDEPFIIVGKEPGAAWAVDDKAIDELTGASSGSPISVKITAHGLETGDFVWFDGLTAASWTTLNDRPLRIEKIDADRFYLLEAALGRVTASGGAWSTFALPAGTARIGNLAALRWPKGKYSTGSDRRYGYPARWDDPDDDGSLPWGTGEPASWPKAIAIFGEGLAMRAYACGFADDTSRVDVSMLGEPSNFLKVDVDAADEASATDSPEDGGYFYVTRGDGDDVTGMAKVYDYMVFAKSKVLTLWTGAFGLTDGGLQMVASLPVGNANFKSIGVVGNDLYFWDPVSGPKRLSTVQQYGDLAIADLARDIPDEILAITPHTSHKIRMLHDRANQCVKWFVCSGGSTSCNRVLVYYYTLDQWHIWTGLYSQCVDAVGSEVASDDGWQQYGARHSGEVVRLDVGNVDGLDDGAGVPVDAEYRTKWYQIPSLLNIVRPLFIDIAYGENGRGDCAIGVVYDNSDELVVDAELEFSRGASAAGYDRGLYDSGGVYDETSRLLLRHNLDGAGSMFQLIFTSASASPWQITDAVVDVAVRGERQ